MSRKIDFAGRDWTAHAQDHWLEHAGNPNFHDYLRIVFVAYGRHAANGHAKLDRGELAHYLVRKDGTLPDRRTIHRALTKAVDLGFLLPQSRALCLVVSSEHVQGGMGNPDQRCPRDHRVKAKQPMGARRAHDVHTAGAPALHVVPNDYLPGSHSAANDYLSAGRSNPNDYPRGSRPTLSPSLSSPTGAPAPEHPSTNEEAS